MTPEELNQKMEFIIEEERRSRLEFQEWSKGITARLVELADLQSQRLDRQDQHLRQHEQRLQEQEKFYRDFLDRTDAYHRQTLHLLNLLLDRLPPAANA